MNSKHLVSQILTQYPILASRMTVGLGEITTIRVSGNDVMHATKLVETHAEEWRLIAISIKDNFGYVRMRNSGLLAAGFCHGAVFFLNHEESIIVTVNTLFNIVGFYFDHKKATRGSMPFPGARTATISYWPYTKYQSECAVDILDVILGHFPEYVVFNNLHASLHINESMIFEYEEKELDLFQVLFSKNIHGAL